MDCDGEVSVDGHSWSDFAYATDFNERYWPPSYAGRSNAEVRQPIFLRPVICGASPSTKDSRIARSDGEYAARRTVGLVISPYVKRDVVDSTLYSTSSMVRSIELLLGLPTMGQHEAAAMPIYPAFGMNSMVISFNVSNRRSM